MVVSSARRRCPSPLTSRYIEALSDWDVSIDTVQKQVDRARAMTTQVEMAKEALTIVPERVLEGRRILSVQSREALSSIADEVAAACADDQRDGCSRALSR